MLSYLWGSADRTNVMEVVMGETCRESAGALPPSQVLELERACDRFEAEWRAGRRPRVEDFLGGIPEPGCSKLVRDLLMLDMTYRRLAGERPAPQDYVGGLAAHHELIDSVFGCAAGASGSNNESTTQGQASASRSVDIDAVAIGKYLVVARLDQGGQGQLFRVVHPGLCKDLVLKLARDPVGPDAGASLISEGRLLAQIDHPNLVRVFDLDFHEGRPYVVMEYVPGANLQQYAMQNQPGARRVAALVAELARVLGALHRRGLVHQDIKPRNVLIDEAGRPRLIDFGLARLRHAWGNAADESSGGTLAYMAPEQARGEIAKVGPAGDIFALGGVLYFLIAGKAPFEGGSSDDQWRRARACDFDRAVLRGRGIPRHLARVALKAMADEPQRRYSSADALAADVEAYLHRPYRIAVLAGLLFCAALAVISWSQWPQPRPGPAAAEVRTEPLRVESLEVELHRRNPPQALGPIGVSAFEARYQDDIRVHARLSAPAYYYLIALNPDGSDQLCLPASRDIAPPPGATLSFPHDPRAGFGLTDGVGLQAFVLVASRRQLPPYSKWRQTLKEFPWKPARAAGVWHYDGDSFRTDVQRGEVRPLADLPLPLEAACRALKSRPGVDAIRSVAFPVIPMPQTDGRFTPP
jgi:predicted Ser/Thr protein kinase